jgi:hypothetical protein
VAKDFFGAGAWGIKEGFEVAVLSRVFCRGECHLASRFLKKSRIEGAVVAPKARGASSLPSTFGLPMICPESRRWLGSSFPQAEFTIRIFPRRVNYAITKN